MRLSKLIDLAIEANEWAIGVNAGNPDNRKEASLLRTEKQLHKLKALHKARKLRLINGVLKEREETHQTIAEMDEQSHSMDFGGE